MIEVIKTCATAEHRHTHLEEIELSELLGAGTSMAGAYGSYFLDGAAGGIIVALQTAVFLLAFLFAPGHGALRRAAA